jgi:hypothetical protein
MGDLIKEGYFGVYIEEEPPASGMVREYEYDEDGAKDGWFDRPAQPHEVEYWTDFIRQDFPDDTIVLELLDYLNRHAEEVTNEIAWPTDAAWKDFLKGTALEVTLPTGHDEGELTLINENWD